eukprot:406205-Lingulodinium_polyedra.AAC.1
MHQLRVRPQDHGRGPEKRRCWAMRARNPPLKEWKEFLAKEGADGGMATCEKDFEGELREKGTRGVQGGGDPVVAT